MGFGDSLAGWFQWLDPWGVSWLRFAMALPQNVLVTGGAGFIGSHLVERLLAEGCVVTVVDDCSTGAVDNLANVVGRPKLTVVESAVSAWDGLQNQVADSDFVFHLAAAVGVDLVVQRPVHTLKTNVRETEALLAAAAHAGTPVLLTSTSEVYGKRDKGAFAEGDDLLIGPPTFSRWGYACSKLLDEFLALAHMKESSLPVIVARLFNTVGPRQIGAHGMVLPRFIAAARAGEPMRVFGDGSQTRCFCDVRDTVEALVRLASSAVAGGTVVNVGGAEEITIRRLAETVRDLLGSSSVIETVPYAEAYGPGFEEMMRRKPDLTRLQELTGFTPSISLADTIRHAAGLG